MWNPIKLKHLGLCCCVWSIHPMGFLNIQTFEFTPSKHFCDSTFCEFPFFTSDQKIRLHFYTTCQVLVINLDKTSSMAKISWPFVRWAMLQTVNWVILPNGMMQNTLQLIMPQVCHISCSAILPALTLYSWFKLRVRWSMFAYFFSTPDSDPMSVFSSTRPNIVNGVLATFLHFVVMSWKCLEQ